MKDETLKMLEQEVKDFEETLQYAEEDLEEAIKWRSTTIRNLGQARKALSDYKK